MKHLLLCFSLLLGSTNFVVASGNGILSKNSITLSRCELIYFYAAQTAQMNNNEGLGKNFLFRASVVTTTNLFINLEGGSVSGRKVKEIVRIRQDTRRQLTGDPVQLISRVNSCDKEALPLAKSEQQRQRVWDGKKFHEVQEYTLNQMIRTLGM